MAKVQLDIILSAVDRASGVMAKVGKSTEDMGARLKASSEQMSRAGNIMIATGTAVMTGLFASAKGAANMGEALKKASQVTGVTVEDLSTLKYAAEQSNVSFETLQGGFIKIARSAKGADALKQPMQLFMEVADRLAKVQNPMERSALAMQLFGRGGAQMLPMLEGGAKGIRELQEEAAALGLGWTTQQADDADNFNDGLAKISETSKQLAASLGKTLMPALTDVFQKLGDIIGKVNKWIEQHPELTEGIAKAAAWVAGLSVAIGGMLKVMSGVSAAVKTWEALAAAIKGVSVAAAGAEAATGGAAAAAGGRAAAGAGGAAAGGGIAAGGAGLVAGGVVIGAGNAAYLNNAVNKYQSGNRYAASTAISTMKSDQTVYGPFGYAVTAGRGIARGIAGMFVHEHRLSSDGQTARTLLSNPEAQASIRRDMRGNAASLGKGGAAPTRP